jgi:diguanylate cyclase (GGDEF)-like protein/putative nucleotidyltransferase with HDIG domain
VRRTWFAARMSLALSLVTVSVLFAAFGLGLVPDPEALALESRSGLARALGLEAAGAVQARDVGRFEAALRQLIDQESELRSAGLRDSAGALIVDVGGHADLWTDPGEQSTANHAWLAIELNDVPWGRAEFSFRPLPAPWLFGLWPGGRVGGLFAFLAGGCFAAFAGYLWYVFRKMGRDADQGMPQRVRQALDALAEGVIVMDRAQRVAHANLAFAKMTSRAPEELIGQRACDLGWHPPRGIAYAKPGLPWDWAMKDGQSVVRVPLLLKAAADKELMLSVNATPVVADDGACRGALATFDDMTEMERKNASMQELLGKLKHSRAEIHRQNQELKLLANRDPLTLCLNRRAFFAELAPLYEQAGRAGAPLSCVMIDVDRFKQINDRHGHTAGDQVLAAVADLLRVKSRNTDLVCRYGGEEFALVLPQTDLEDAAIIADRIRVALAEKPLAGVPVTASFGVSAIRLGPNGPQGLLDQADKAMYAAKRNGRNRVMQFNELPAEESAAAAAEPVAPTPLPLRADTAIPYPAVTALISALAYRDSLTAEHSRRVANLCVVVARDLLSQSDVYLLEVAALLHDIGKLGVPDAILFKPGALTEDEWKIMRLHDRMGVEIVTAAFASDALTRIVAAHHAWYGGSPKDPGLPTGDAIPLAARILTIADAYDAMVSDRVYRKGRSREAAFAELRRCAGTQFDPELVDRLITVVQATAPADQTDSLGSGVSKETALLIGTQIERLAGAIDEHDATALAGMATQLVATARECGVPAIVEVAGRLQRAAAAGSDWVEIVGVTNDLLELCRSTQSIYLRDARSTGARRAGDDRRASVIDTADDRLTETKGRHTPPPFELPDFDDRESVTERLVLPPGLFDDEQPTGRHPIPTDTSEALRAQLASPRR